jgi:hypothetical protein
MVESGTRTLKMTSLAGNRLLLRHFPEISNSVFEGTTERVAANLGDRPISRLLNNTLSVAVSVENGGRIRNSRAVMDCTTVEVPDVVCNFRKPKLVATLTECQESGPRDPQLEKSVGKEIVEGRALDTAGPTKCLQ